MNSLSRTELFIHENNEDNLETTENDPATFEEHFGTIMNLESRGFEKDFGVIEEASINPS